MNTEEKSTVNWEKDDEVQIQSMAYALGELAFIFVPLVVIVIALCFKGEFHHIICEPEWAILASVMFGQSIVKLVHTIGIKGQFWRYGAGFWVSFMILFGLVPSLSVLVLMITTNMEGRPTWMGWLQVLLFISGAILFYNMNQFHAKEELEESQKGENKD